MTVSLCNETTIFYFRLFYEDKLVSETFIRWTYNLETGDMEHGCHAKYLTLVERTEE
jgi:hypothetical protein